ncbi:uncharacterized protein LOC130010856 [Patella vulgata]|uniref:uncharacterized protein LOC130010856 n=1 Tax=Patella vulgata TaxID=6465 RepID=UPI0024A83A84|nr:uncharacterized protein LOC130010856 [Patella vulgata]
MEVKEVVLLFTLLHLSSSTTSDIKTSYACKSQVYVSCYTHILQCAPGERIFLHSADYGFTKGRQDCLRNCPDDHSNSHSWQLMDTKCTKTFERDHLSDLTSMCNGREQCFFHSPKSTIFPGCNRLWRLWRRDYDEYTYTRIMYDCRQASYPITTPQVSVIASPPSTHETLSPNTTDMSQSNASSNPSSMITSSANHTSNITDFTVNTVEPDASEMTSPNYGVTVGIITGIVAVICILAIVILVILIKRRRRRIIKDKQLGISNPAYVTNNYAIITTNDNSTYIDFCGPSTSVNYRNNHLHNSKNFNSEADTDEHVYNNVGEATDSENMNVYCNSMASSIVAERINYNHWHELKDSNSAPSKTKNVYNHLNDSEVVGSSDNIYMPFDGIGEAVKGIADSECEKRDISSEDDINNPRGVNHKNKISRNLSKANNSRLKKTPDYENVAIFKDK